MPEGCWAPPIIAEAVYCEAQIFTRDSGSTYSCNLPLNHIGPHQDFGEENCSSATWTDENHY